MAMSAEQIQSVLGKAGFQPTQNTNGAVDPNNQAAIDARVKSWTDAAQTSQQSAVQTPAKPQEPGLSSRISADLSSRVGAIKNDLSTAIKAPAIDPNHTALQAGMKTAGNIGGAVSDVGSELFKSLYNVLPQNVKDNATAQYQKSDIPKLLASPQAQKASQMLNDFAKQHPVASTALKAVMDSLGGVATVEGAGALKDLAVTGGKSALEKGTSTLANAKEALSGLTNKEGRTALADVVDMSKPILSKSEQATAIAQGRGTEATALKPAVIKPQPIDIERAKAIADVVNPKDSLISNVNKVNDAITKEGQSVANGLKQANIAYKPSELDAHLSRLQPPISLQADDKMFKMYNLAKDKFNQFVAAQPPTLDGILQARKNFDVFIKGEIPAIFDDPTAKPLHQALRDMRMGANDFIASKLPDDASSQAFKASLRRQNMMYQAADHMSEKAVSTELKGGKIQQGYNKFKTEHPVATKAIKTGAQLVGIGEAARHLP